MKPTPRTICRWHGESLTREKKSRFTDLMREYNSINDRINQALVSRSINCGEYGSMSLATAAKYIQGWDNGICINYGHGNFEKFLDAPDLADLVVRSRHGFMSEDFFEDGRSCDCGVFNNSMNDNSEKDSFRRRERCYISEMRNALLVDFIKAVSDMEV